MASAAGGGGGGRGNEEHNRVLANEEPRVLKSAFKKGPKQTRKISYNTYPRRVYYDPFLERTRDPETGEVLTYGTGTFFENGLQTINTRVARGLRRRNNVYSPENLAAAFYSRENQNKFNRNLKSLSIEPKQMTKKAVYKMMERGITPVGVTRFFSNEKPPSLNLYGPMPQVLQNTVRRRKDALARNRAGNPLARMTGKLSHLTGIMSMENEAEKQKMLEKIQMGTTLYKAKQMVEENQAAAEAAEAAAAAQAEAEAKAALEKDMALAASGALHPWAYNELDDNAQERYNVERILQENPEILHEYYRTIGRENLIPKGGKRKTKKTTRKHKL